MKTPAIIWKAEPPENQEACALYRFFDADHKLLYVGIANSPLRRLKQHRVKAEWFSLATCCEIDWLQTRAHAVAAEAEAIATENPIHNDTPGRPLTGTEKRKRCVVWLEPSTAESIREGSRNLSQGIEALVERALQIGAGNLSHGIERLATRKSGPARIDGS